MIKVLLLLVLVSIAATAPATITTYSRIISETTLNSMAVLPSACSTTVVLLNSDNAKCERFSDPAGNILSGQCPTGVLGSTIINCLYASSSITYCVALNPNTNLLFPVDGTNGGLLRSAGGLTISGMTAPYRTAFQFRSSASYLDILVVDGQTNSFIYLISWLTTDANGPYQTRTITQFSNTQPVANILWVSSTNFILAFKGDTTLTTYSSVAGAQVSTIGSFTNINQFYIDTLGRYFVHDLGCDCVKIMDSGMNWIKTIDLAANGITNLKKIQTSKNHIYLLDDNGVVRYNESLVITAFSATNSTCNSLGGTVSVTLSGGVMPYSWVVYPDVKRQYGYSSATSSMVLTPRYYHNIVPYPIYIDSIASEFSDYWLSTTIGAGNSTSTVNPHTGNCSYSMNMAKGATYGFNGYGAINTTAYRWLELWINVGDGGQYFSISIPSSFNWIYNPGDIPPNTWTKLTFDLLGIPGVAPFYYQPTYSSILFKDLSMAATGNTMYVDDVTMLPHTTGNERYLAITDSCQAGPIYSPTFVIENPNELRLQVNATSTSCAAGGVDGTLAYDGTLTATPSGGVAPYKYAWNFIAGANTSNVAGLGAFNGRLTGYDNDFPAPYNIAFSTATGIIVQDPAYFRSPPYSFSFLPLQHSDTMVVLLPFKMYQVDYPNVEFYANGGAYGGQTVQFRLMNNLEVVGQNIYIHKLAGIPIIPKNKWIKVTYPVPSSVPIFTGIQFMGIGGTPQKRLYIDDLSFPSVKYMATVTDAANCVSSFVPIAVPTPTMMTVKPIIKHASCFGFSDGKVTLNVTGGTSPFTYDWANTNNNVLDNLPTQVVNVVVTDSNTCHAQQPTTTARVLHPPTISIDYTVSAPKCAAQQGSISATAYGGVPPYTYTWTAPTATNPNAALDTNFQVAPVAVFSDQISNFFQFVNISNSPASEPVCFGADATNSTRTGYCSIQFGQPNADGNVLTMGCSGCIDSARYARINMWMHFSTPSNINHMNILFTKQGLPVSELIPVASAITDTKDGWVKVSVNFTRLTVVFADYITFSTNETTLGSVYLDDLMVIPIATAEVVAGKNVQVNYRSIVTINAGSYKINVDDGNGCSTTRTIVVTEPKPLVANKTETPALKDDGTITVNVTGGTPPYAYHWEDLNTTASYLTDLSDGSYKVTVTDANGCFVQLTAVVPKKSKSDVGLVTGISVGVGVFVLGAAAFAGFYMYRQKVAVVKTLKNVEEGERRAYKIDFDALELKSMIGAGSFGEVFSGEYKGADVAIKKLKTQQMNKNQIDEFAKEAAVMVGLRHPNILLFMGVCLEPERLCIVTDFMPRGNLSDILRDESITIPVQVVFNMALDTLKGLQFIHSSGIIHRDLKSPNLLVDKHWNIRIADFGLSCAKHAANDEAQVSLLWSAPEILSREPDCYSFASDMYSFGIIMWELLSKKLPWEGCAAGAITSMVVGGQRPPIPTHWDPLSVRLITESWAQDPNARLTVKAARAVVEEEILANISDLDIGSSSYNFAKKDASNLTVQPPHPPFAIVAATIESNASLWDANPRVTSKAMEEMGKIFRELAVKLGGYEIAQDSSTLYGFANSNNAVNFCLRSSTALRDHKWDPILLAMDACTEVKHNDEVMYRGPRVRMAAHWGAPSLRKDATTGKVAYVGNSMNVPVAMQAHAHPGSVVLCQEMYNRVMSRTATLEVDPFCMNALGQTEILGNPMSVFELVPTALKELLYMEKTTPSGVEDKETWFANMDDIKLGNIIGTGTYGNVYAATYNGKKVAAKKFTYQKVTSQTLLEMRTECAILRGLQHENVIKFEAMCMQSPNHYLLTELMERGSLLKVLDDHTIDLPWTLKLSITKDIANGLAYLHKNDIIHRDVKSSNLLVSSTWTVKIADFGFSRIKSANQTMTQCGTVAWTAPEIFDGGHYTEKADVFSFAVVLWELIFRKRPWAGKHSMKIIQIMETGGRLPMTNIPPDTPKVIIDLVTACWDQLPSARPSFDQIVQQLQQM